MRSYKPLDTDEVNAAQGEAIRGAATGAVKWGAASAILGGLGYAYSPIYRGLTVQFKVYLQMTGMVFGGMIEADARLRRFEHQVRIQRRVARDRAVWQSYEAEFAGLGDDDDDDDDDVKLPNRPASLGGGGRQQQQQQSKGGGGEGVGSKK